MASLSRWRYSCLEWLDCPYATFSPDCLTIGQCISRQAPIIDRIFLVSSTHFVYITGAAPIVKDYEVRVASGFGQDRKKCVSVRRGHHVTSSFPSPHLVSNPSPQNPTLIINLYFLLEPLKPYSTFTLGRSQVEAYGKFTSSYIPSPTVECFHDQPIVYVGKTSSCTLSPPVEHEPSQVGTYHAAACGR